MKLLFLSPYLPYPPQSGGPRRLHGLLNEIGKRHDVALLALTAPGEDSEEALEATRHFCTEVVTVESDRLDRALDRKTKRGIQFRSLLHIHSYERLIYHDPLFQRALDRLVARDNFDVITTEFGAMAAYNLPSTTRLVLDEHNIEYDILRRTALAEGGGHFLSPRKLYNRVNYLKLRREERAAWRRFDGVTVPSKRDMQIVQRDVPGKLAAVVPNAVDTDYFRPAGVPTEPGTILFFGAINYFPNTDGVLFFLDEVFPFVKRLHPRARLLIVGQQPPASISGRASDDVTVTGLVDDIRPYIERAAVVIVPLRIGGGTRLKIVEAMAMGKPIVSTHLGAEGLEVDDGENILLADRPEEFADQVARVLGDPALAARLGESARRCAEARYTWRSAVDRLERFYQELPPHARSAHSSYKQRAHISQGD